MRDAERRETLHAFKHRLDDYASTVEKMKTEPKGAVWLNKQLADLRHPEHGWPAAIRRVLAEMVRTRSPALKRQRMATAREVEVMRETGRLAAERFNEKERADAKPKEVMIDEEIGNLRGLSVLYAENDIREILIKDLEVKLTELRTVDVDTATRYELGKWAKWVGEIEIKLKTCQEIIGAGRTFFERENIAKLADLTENSADESQVMAIARQC